MSEAGHEPLRVFDIAIEAQRRALMRDKNGVALGNEANALQIVRTADYFRDVHFDSFWQVVRVADGAAARDWGDDDDTAAVEFLQREFTPKMRIEVAARAVRKVARERQRDALRDYIEALPEWDGVPRIDRWVIDALGCSDTPYTRAAGANWIKALIARALHPGADAQECYVLEGPQGIGKTRALRALGGDFYVEITAPIGSPDFYREIRGAWLADLAELSQIKRSSVEVVKQILSRHEDRYVEKYEREPRAYPRRCVFAGTTNEATYLADSTGNRRFVPLRCGDVRPDLIAANREQYLAEAALRVAAGEGWWQLPEAAAHEAAEEREARRMTDPWEPIVAEYLLGRTETTAGEVLNEAIKKPRHDQQLADQQRVGRVLASLGWVRGRRQRTNGIRVYPWSRPAENGTRDGERDTESRADA
jgi:predicted P-loop ATPase